MKKTIILFTLISLLNSRVAISDTCNKDLFIGKWIDFQLKTLSKAQSFRFSENLQNDPLMDRFIQIEKKNGSYIIDISNIAEHLVFRNRVNIDCSGKTRINVYESRRYFSFSMELIQPNIVKLVEFKPIPLNINSQVKVRLDVGNFLIRLDQSLVENKRLEEACSLYCGKYQDKDLELSLSLYKNTEDNHLYIKDIQQKKDYSFMYYDKKRNGTYRIGDNDGLVLIFNKENNHILITTIRNPKKNPLFLKEKIKLYSVFEVQPGPYLIDVPKANIRSKASTSSSVFYQLKQGDSVQVIHSVGDKKEFLYNRIAPWVKIRDSKGREGYIWGGLLKPVEKK